MSDTYNASVAEHYASYRPPLHAMILNKSLAGRHFATGLDIGCGTGQSAVALAPFCDRVIAVDPSQAMLDIALPHDDIEYRSGSGESLPVSDHSVDLISFAGSLFYTKNDRQIAELERVGSSSCVIVVYDFEILLYQHIVNMGLTLPEDNAHYDHTVNLSDVLIFKELVTRQETVDLKVSWEELAHLLLSTHDRLVAFQELWEVDDPFGRLVDELLTSQPNPDLQADIYYATYRMGG